MAFEVVCWYRQPRPVACVRLGPGVRYRKVQEDVGESSASRAPGRTAFGIGVIMGRPGFAVKYTRGTQADCAMLILLAPPLRPPRWRGVPACDRGAWKGQAIRSRPAGRTTRSLQSSGRAP